MKIYVSHAKTLNYKDELYAPLRNSELNNQHTIILPHEHPDKQFNSKDFIKTSCDILIAEVSHRATGLGIELGWADILGIPIICIYKKETKVAGSIKLLTKNIIKYTNKKDMIGKLENAISEINN